MTPEDRSLIFRLAVVPGGPPPISRQDFLEQFGAPDGVALGLQLLRDAIGRRDGVDVEYALTVCFTFGFTEDHLPLLLSLATAEWHQRHEDVASALDDLRSPRSVDALTHLAEWVPAYLQFDDARALAVKAIWALGNIGTAAARNVLRSLAQSPDAIVANNARDQLAR